MDLSPELIEQLLKVFEAELSDQIQVITDVLLDLEKGVQGDDRQQALESMFRAAHNTKGAARGVSVDSVAEIAHELETLFIGFKEQKIEPTPDTIDLCLRSLDCMADAMLAHVDDKPLEFDLAGLLQQLGDACRSGSIDGEGLAPATQSAGGTVPTDDVQAGLSRDAKPSNAEQSSHPPSRASIQQKSINIDIAKVGRLAAHAEQLQSTNIHLADNLRDVRTLNQKIQHVYALWRRTRIDDLGHSPGAEDSSRLYAETISGLNEISDLSGKVQQTMSGNGKRLGLLTESLRDDVRMMRLVPASTLLRPMERIVRDIARELGKKIVFRVKGDDIEIDRKVLDGIRDPLIHLVRNSIDHGIEAPAERKKVGKKPAGQLTLEVRSSGGQILLRVEDDGAGISEQKIAQTALRKKLISEAELAELDSSELLELIFRPGFSSKRIITHISGRGVGLDVVRANLKSLKGSVRIDTRVGEFTRFTLSLPLTLATDRGLVVAVGGQNFAIPTTNVDRVLTINPDEVASVSGGRALLFDGRTIPIISLATVLKVTAMAPVIDGQLNIVIVSRAWSVAAFEVNEIIGERELVIKPLLPPLNGMRNVSGATQTGSGEIILILNPGQILESAMMPGMAASTTADATGEAAVARPHILVVDDSISVRTLEKSIFEDHGYKVSLAADGKKAWESVQKDDFDLIVTDIEMPHMDGFEFTRKVKGSEKYAEIPVIIVSSLARDVDRKRGIEVGADAYIVKGQFETRALLDVVVQLA